MRMHTCIHLSGALPIFQKSIQFNRYSANSPCLPISAYEFSWLAIESAETSLDEAALASETPFLQTWADHYRERGFFSGAYELVPSISFLPSRAYTTASVVLSLALLDKY